MTGWLTRLRDRPIAEEERRTAMSAVVVLLAATALLLALTRPGERTPRNTGRAAASLLGHAAAGHAPQSPAGAAPLTPEAARAARLFLRGYLGYLYGHSPASRIKGTTAGLLHSLQAHPPRGRPDAQARGARLLSLHSTPAPAGLAGVLSVVAVVNDGGLINYPIGLLLAPRGGRLLVTEVGGA